MKRNTDPLRRRAVWPAIPEPAQPKDSRTALVVALCLIVLSMALLLALI